MAALKGKGHGVYHRGEALKDASAELRADREVVMEAVKQWGALLHASAELQDDREIVMEAIKSDFRTPRFCPPRPSCRAIGSS